MQLNTMQNMQASYKLRISNEESYMLFMRQTRNIQY